MGTVQGLRVSFVKMQISGFQLQLFLIQESQDKAPWICVFNKAPGEFVSAGTLQSPVGTILAQVWTGMVTGGFRARL